MEAPGTATRRPAAKTMQIWSAPLPKRSSPADQAQGERYVGPLSIKHLVLAAAGSLKRAFIQSARFFKMQCLRSALLDLHSQVNIDCLSLRYS